MKFLLLIKQNLFQNYSKKNGKKILIIIIFDRFDRSKSHRIIFIDEIQTKQDSNILNIYIYIYTSSFDSLSLSLSIRLFTLSFLSPSPCLFLLFPFQFLTKSIYEKSLERVLNEKLEQKREKHETTEKFRKDNNVRCSKFSKYVRATSEKQRCQRIDIRMGVALSILADAITWNFSMRSRNYRSQKFAKN